MATFTEWSVVERIEGDGRRPLVTRTNRRRRPRQRGRRGRGRERLDRSRRWLDPEARVRGSPPKLHSDWGDVEVWFGDDRCVSHKDPRSNQLLVREALLDRLSSRRPCAMAT